jgi:hypothetical protein
MGTANIPGADRTLIITSLALVPLTFQFTAPQPYLRCLALGRPDSHRMDTGDYTVVRSSVQYSVRNPLGLGVAGKSLDGAGIQVVRKTPFAESRQVVDSTLREGKKSAVQESPVCGQIPFACIPRKVFLTSSALFEPCVIVPEQLRRHR